MILKLVSLPEEALPTVGDLPLHKYQLAHIDLCEFQERRFKLLRYSILKVQNVQRYQCVVGMFFPAIDFVVDDN